MSILPTAAFVTACMLWGSIAIAQPASCVGDCNADEAVTIDELLTCVNIDLGTLLPNICLACEPYPDAEVTITSIMTAVNNALSGCSSTAAATATFTPLPACGRTPTPSRVCDFIYEPYRCAIDENGCAIRCECCNFEEVGGCCQLFNFPGDGKPSCFELRYGSDYAYCIQTLHGSVQSSCPNPVSCNANTGRCERP